MTTSTVSSPTPVPFAVDIVPFNANMARIYGGVNGCVYSLNFFYGGISVIQMRIMFGVIMENIMGVLTLVVLTIHIFPFVLNANYSRFYYGSYGLSYSGYYFYNRFNSVKMGIGFGLWQQQSILL